MSTQTFMTTWDEDGTNVILGRVTSDDATGSQTGKDGEGYFVKQADLTSIARKVFDLDSTTPTTATDSSTLTVSSVIDDTPDTTNVLWTVDSYGYNFTDRIASSIFTTGNHEYLVEYTFTMTSGTVGHGRFKGKCSPLVGS